MCGNTVKRPTELTVGTAVTHTTIHPQSREATRGQRRSENTEPNLTSAEMRLFPLFLRQTPVGDCTSSEEVPDAWSLSPSDPIFRFSWTISGDERREKFTESTGGLTNGAGL